MTEVIEEILKTAWQKGATDVHLVADAYPFMRVNGVLEPFGYEKIGSDVTLDFVLLYMTEAAREVFEEKGTYSFSLNSGEAGRVRVTAYHQSGAVALSFRFQKTDGELSQQSLHMPEQLWNLSDKKQGLILVAGPAGSGKTTTLASLIKKMNEERALHIVTIERPIEYIHPHKKSLVTQSEVGSDCFDAAEAIGDAMRADADVILVSDWKGTAVTEAALAAAEAGALVLMEASAGSAMGALEQLIDGFEINRQKRVRERLMNALEAIVYQYRVPDEEGTLQVVYKVVESKKKQ